MKLEKWLIPIFLLGVLLLAGCTGNTDTVPSDSSLPAAIETGAPALSTQPPVTLPPETESPETQPPAAETAAPETEPTIPETEPPATAPAPEEPETEPSSDTQISALSEADLPYVQGAYALPLSRYCTALTEEWTEFDYFDHEMSSLGAFYYDGNPLENVGFALIDLDGDRVPELIIGAIEAADVDPSVFEIWTLVDGVPVKLVEAHVRNHYFLEYHAQEAEPFYLISNDGSNGAANFANYYYRVENGGLVLEEGIVFDATANSDSPWFYTTDEDWNPGNDIEIDSSTAQEITDGHRNQVIAVAYYPFTLFIS